MKVGLSKILNLALYLAGCAALGTGLLLTYRLPHGSEGGRGLRALGLDRHDWGDIHLVLGLAITGLVIAHLVMHRAWLRKIAARGKAWPLALGLLGGAAVVIGLVALPVTREPRGRHHANVVAAADAPVNR